MNNFNSIFIIIKKHCGSNGTIDGPDCFEKIAHEAGIPLNKLDFFLNTLQNLDLIKYSSQEHYIKLTYFGKKQQRLFTEV